MSLFLFSLLSAIIDMDQAFEHSFIEVNENTHTVGMQPHHHSNRFATGMCIAVNSNSRMYKCSSTSLPYVAVYAAHRSWQLWPAHDYNKQYVSKSYAVYFAGENKNK